MPQAKAGRRDKAKDNPLNETECTKLCEVGQFASKITIAKRTIRGVTIPTIRIAAFPMKMIRCLI